MNEAAVKGDLEPEKSLCASTVGMEKSSPLTRSDEDALVLNGWEKRAKEEDSLHKWKSSAEDVRGLKKRNKKLPMHSSCSEDRSSEGDHDDHLWKGMENNENSENRGKDNGDIHRGRSSEKGGEENKAIIREEGRNEKTLSRHDVCTQEEKKCSLLGASSPYSSLPTFFPLVQHSSYTAPRVLDPDRREQRETPFSFPLFPSLDGTVRVGKCSTLWTSHSGNAHDAVQAIGEQEEGHFFFSRTSVLSIGIPFDHDSDSYHNAVEEEEEERRILAAVGAWSDDEEEPSTWRLEEGACGLGPESCSREHYSQEGHQFPKRCSSLLKDKRLTASLLKQLLCCHSLDRVAGAELRMDVRELVGVEQLHVLLPSLISLRLNHSWIPSIRCLGGRFHRLKILWLNRCHLEELQGIEALAPSLAELYVAFNHISSLSPLLGVSKTLEVLDVEGNNVKATVSLQCVLHSLCKVHTLTFQGNPAEEVFSGERLLVSSPPLLLPFSHVKQEGEGIHEEGTEKAQGDSTSLFPSSPTQARLPLLGFRSSSSTPHTTAMTPRIAQRCSERNGWGQEVVDLRDVFGYQNPALRFREWVQQLMPWLQYLDDIPTLHSTCLKSSFSSPVAEAMPQQEEGKGKWKTEGGEHLMEVEGGKSKGKGGEEQRENDCKPTSCTDICVAGNRCSQDQRSPPTGSSSPCSRDGSASPSTEHRSAQLPNSSGSPFFRCRGNSSLKKGHENLAERTVCITPDDGEERSPRKANKWRRRGSGALLDSPAPSAVREELRFLQDCVREHGFDVLQQTLLERNECLHNSRSWTSYASSHPRAFSPADDPGVAFPFDGLDEDNLQKKGGKAFPSSSLLCSDSVHLPFSVVAASTASTSAITDTAPIEEPVMLVPERTRGDAGISCDHPSRRTSPPVMAPAEEAIFPTTCATSVAACVLHYRKCRNKEGKEELRHPFCTSPNVSERTTLTGMEANDGKEDGDAARDAEEEWDCLKAQLWHRMLSAWRERWLQRRKVFHLSVLTNSTGDEERLVTASLQDSAVHCHSTPFTPLQEVPLAALLSSPSLSSCALAPPCDGAVAGGVTDGIDCCTNTQEKDWAYALARPMGKVQGRERIKHNLHQDHESNVQDGRPIPEWEEARMEFAKPPETHFQNEKKQSSNQYLSFTRWWSVPSHSVMLMRKEMDEEEQDFNTFLKEEVSRTRAKIAREGIRQSGTDGSNNITRSLCHSPGRRKLEGKDDNGTRSKRGLCDFNEKTECASNPFYSHRTTTQCNCREWKHNETGRDFFADQSSFEVVELETLEHSLS